MLVRSILKTSVVLLPLGITLSASANTATDLRQLEPILVQAPYHSAVTPWTTRTDREKLDDLQVQGWDDLARSAESGLRFNKQSQSLNIRGLDESRINTRIDGIRQPWLNDGARGVRGGLSAFDFNTLWALEIVRGVDSNAVGSGGLGAAVKLQTLSPGDLLSASKDFAALVKTDLNTLDQSTGIHAAIAGRQHSTEWLIQAGVRQGQQVSNMGQVGGYGLSRSQPDPANYVQQAYLLKVQQRINSAHRVGVTGEHFEKANEIQNFSAQGPTTLYIGRHHQTKDESQRDRLSIDYQYRGVDHNSLIESAVAKVYWQQVSLDSDLTAMRRPDPRSRIVRGDPFKYGYPFGSFVRHNSMSESMYGADAEVSKRIEGAVAHNLTFGGEWFKTGVNQYSSGEDNCPAISTRLRQPFGPRPCNILHSNRADVPKVVGTQWAAWLQDEMTISELGLTVSPSLRYDNFQQSPAQAFTQAAAFKGHVSGAADGLASSGQRFSPKLLTAWSLHPEATLYAQYATGFNAPSATQLYSHYGSYGSYLNVGNPALKPETSQGYEVGLQLGNYQRGASLTYFDNQYQNLIESNVPVGPKQPIWGSHIPSLYPLGITTAANIEEARIFGLEARGHLELGHGWRTWASVAWAEGRDQQTQQYLNSVAPLTTTWGLGYRHQQWGAHAVLSAAAARTHVKYPQPTASLPLADYQTPGYGVVDLAAYWRPPTFDGMTVHLGVYNVFDKQYWQASNMPSAGAKPAALAQLTQRPIDWYSEPGRHYRLSVTYQY